MGWGEICGFGSEPWRGRRGRESTSNQGLARESGPGGGEREAVAERSPSAPSSPETGCFSLALGLGRPWASLPTPDEGTVYFEVHSPGVYRDLFGTLHAFDPLDQQMPLALSLPAKVTRRWNSAFPGTTAGAWLAHKRTCSEIGTRRADSGRGGERKQGKGPGLLILASLPCEAPWPPPLSGSWGVCVDPPLLPHRFLSEATIPKGNRNS